MDGTVLLDAFYSNPNVEDLKGLSSADFDSFLVDLFRRAGYQVTQGDGSLVLSYDNGPAALAFINYGIVRRVGPDSIEKLQEACSNFRSVHDINVLGIMITRFDYIDEVRAANYSDPPLVLLNGDQLIRYYRFLVEYRMEAQHAFPLVAPTVMPFVDSVRHIYTSRPNVLTVTNNKGGIGKSTTALNVAYGLAEKGKSVLAIDLDPQANFTEMLGGLMTTLSYSHIGRYFVGTTELPHLIQGTPFQGVKMIAAHPDMRKAAINPEFWLHSQFAFAHMLRHPSIVNHPQAGPYGFDWVVIDTPPEMGFYTQAALAAANYLLAPTFPSRAGNNGIEILIKTVDTIRRLTNVANHAKFIGFVATRYSDARSTAAVKEDYAELRRYIARLVRPEAFADPQKPSFLPITIPDTPRVISMTKNLIDTTQSGQSFRVFDKEGTGRQDAGGAYKQLLEEVLKRASIT